MAINQTVTVEIYLGTALGWVDISQYAQRRDGEITITRGRSGEDAVSSTGQCTVTLDNRDGRFTPRNPSGPYYGLLGRNTPIRVGVATSAPAAATFVAAGSASSGAIATPGMPAGVAAGDTLLMLAAVEQTTDLVGYPTTDQTWTVLAEVEPSTGSASSTAGNLRLFGKPYNADDPDPTVVSGAGSSDCIAQVAAFTGLPLSIHGVSLLAGATGGTIAYPALSITQDNCVALVCGWQNDDWTSVAALAGMTELGEPDQIGVQGIVWDYVIQTTATDIPAGDFTVTGGGFASTQAITIALDPAAAQRRFSGFVTEWPVDWDTSGTDIYVAIEANGVMRRLDQGNPPTYSPLRRAIAAIQALTDDVLAYWPLEDASGTTQATSGLIDGRPLIPRGYLGQGAEIGFGSSQAPPGSSGSADFDQSDSVVGHVSNVSTTTAWSVEFWFRGEAGDSDWGIFPVRWSSPEATVALGWRVNIDSTANTVSVIADDGASPPSFTTVCSHSTDVDDDTWHYYLVTAEASGGNVDIDLYIDGVSVASGTRAGANLRNIRSTFVGLGSSGTEQQGQLCHLAFYAGLRSPGTRLAPGRGYVGETAGVRLARLTTEDQISFDLTGVTDATVRMGAQQAASMITLLRDAERTDGGILYEPRTDFDLGYRSLGSLYNQPVTVTLDYASHQMTRLGPVEDDRFLANDVTVTREGGGSARAVQSTGALSIQAPPDGIGSYPGSGHTVNVVGDDQLADIAGWKLLLGTIDEPRYPSLQLDLASTHLTSLVDQIKTLDVGDRLQVSNPPDGRGAPETIDLLLQGYTETFSRLTYTMQLNCSPASPYNVPTISDDSADAGTPGISRYDTAASEFVESFDATDTSVAVVATEGPGWTTDPDDLPFDIMVEGERITVTAVSGTPALARFVGVGSGDSQNNASLTGLGLPANAISGDLILIFASIRNTAATVNLPGSWTTLSAFGTNHVKIFGRIYNGVWTMPTVTFSGGAAGDDTIGQVCAFRNVLITPDATANQTNASAQNIATPALDVTPRGRMVIWAGWKQDDWTSAVHVNGLATEINERTGTAGNDAAQIWTYRYFDPAVDIGASSFTVTGGAAAVSKACTLALNDVQEFTMTRSVNGVVKGHSSSTPFSLFDPDKWGL